MSGALTCSIGIGEPFTPYVLAPFRNECCSSRKGLPLRTHAAAYRDVSLYYGGMSFTTARPYVTATCFVENGFPQR